VSERAASLGMSFRKKAGYSNQSGYIVKRVPISNDKRKDVFIHVEVMEKAIGRSLEGKELVHHIDCDKRNNDLGNLHLFKSMSEHSKAHRSIEKLLPALISNGIVMFNKKTGLYEFAGDCFAAR
jgi:cold shock CspA family protein